MKARAAQGTGNSLNLLNNNCCEVTHLNPETSKPMPAENTECEGHVQ
jgi:hypothetical protein